jgi:hypothetical protein
MVKCGDCDRRCLDFAVGRNELLERPEGTAAEFASNGIRTRHIAVDDPEQADRLSLVLELLVDAGVVAAEGTHADHGYVYDVV